MGGVSQSDVGGVSRSADREYHLMFTPHRLQTGVPVTGDSQSDVGGVPESADRENTPMFTARRLWDN